MPLTPRPLPAPDAPPPGPLAVLEPTDPLPVIESATHVLESYHLYVDAMRGGLNR
jgi:hypothetical protein